jgi:hypothetical protein
LIRHASAAFRRHCFHAIIFIMLFAISRFIFSIDFRRFSPFSLFIFAIFILLRRRLRLIISPLFH